MAGSVVWMIKLYKKLFNNIILLYKDKKNESKKLAQIYITKNFNITNVKNYTNFGNHILNIFI